MWSPNFVRFALSLTISEINANLCFYQFSRIFRMFKNVILLSLTVQVIPKFHPFLSFFNRFWEKCGVFFLIFQNFCKFFEILAKFLKFYKCSKMLFCYYWQYIWSQICVRFWDKCKFMFYFISMVAILNYRETMHK